MTKPHLITCRKCTRRYLGSAISDDMKIAGVAALADAASKKMSSTETITTVYAAMRRVLEPDGIYCEHTVARFWSKVDRRNENGCWLWLAKKDGKGYGSVFANDRLRKAHIVSYEIIIGGVPQGKVLRHACDNPPCVNPQHLIPGTHQENIADMWARGRARPGHVPGSKNGLSKLTEDQVLIIRRRVAAGETRTAIGKEFGLSTTGISLICLRKNWRHI